MGIKYCIIQYLISVGQGIGDIKKMDKLGLFVGLNFIIVGLWMVYIGYSLLEYTGFLIGTFFIGWGWMVLTIMSDI